MRSRRGRMTASPAIDIALLSFGVSMFALSLLVLFPAPMSALWIAAIIVIEWGHFVALFCCFLAVSVARRNGVIPRCSAALLLAAALVYVLPLGRAITLARELPARTIAAFGEHPTARVPLSVLDLLRGVTIGPVDVTEHIYATEGSKQLKLDLYRASAHASAQPLVIVIHGGSWNGGNKRELPALDRYLASSGYAVAAINYRHAPTWRAPAPVEDLFRAIEFLRLHAAEFGIDANHIVLIGRSAGGQIALSAGYANRDPAIRGVVAFYAPVDLPLAYRQPSAPGVLDSCRVLNDYIGGTPAQNAHGYAAASPVNFVGEDTPATLIIHGDLDPIVWPVQGELIAATLQRAGRPYFYLRLPWATHGCDANLSGPSGQLSLYAIDRFLSSVLPTSEHPQR